MSNTRRGAALVELAIFLPLLFLIAMATIETCRMIYLRHSLKIAAYECARLAIIPGVTASDIQLQCDAILMGRRIQQYKLTCTPSNPQELQLGDLFVAEVEAPASEAALVGSWFYRGKLLCEKVTTMAEY